MPHSTSLQFTGRFDQYEITCETCTGNLTVTPSDTAFDGKRVSCSECGAEGIAENDGGIWKLYNSDSSLNISVV